MKVIAHTKYDYIVELSATEFGLVVGDNAYSMPPSIYGNGKLAPIGSNFNVVEWGKHVASLSANDKNRKDIAEQLRCAAMLIENTPSVFSLPKPEMIQPPDAPATP
jgi:hypothetical protein